MDTRGGVRGYVSTKVPRPRPPLLRCITSPAVCPSQAVTERPLWQEDMARLALLLTWIVSVVVRAIPFPGPTQTFLRPVIVDAFQAPAPTLPTRRLPYVPKRSDLELCGYINGDTGRHQ